MKIFIHVSLFIILLFSTQVTQANNEFFETLLKKYDFKECGDSAKVICNYVQATKLFDGLNEDSDIRSMELDKQETKDLDKLITKMNEYFLIVINEYETGNWNTDELIYVDALQKLVRGEYIKLNTLQFDDLKNIFINNGKLIALGEVYNTWRYCLWSDEFYRLNQPTLKDTEVKYLIKKIDTYCNRFLVNDSKFPTYSKDHPLGKIWSEYSKEQIMFDVHISLYYINRDRYQNSEAAVSNALRAEKIYYEKKHEWVTKYENRLSEVYRSLGVSYIKGYGVPVNTVKGIKFLEKAALLNDMGALFHLAQMYEGDHSGLFDLFKAREYYLKILEIQANEYAALFKLGRIYLYGFGAEKDINQAQKYFLSAKKNNDEALANPKNIDNWAHDEAEKYQKRIKEYLSGFEGEDYLPRIADVCNHLYHAFENNRPTSHLLRVCKDEANHNLSSAIDMTEVYRSGIGVPKDTYQSYILSTNLIDRLEKDTYERTKFVDNFLNKDEYLETKKNAIIFLKGQIALSVFTGSLREISADEAYKNLESYLFQNGKPVNISDNWYLQDWFMLISMKIDGWGTNKDIEGASELIDLIQSAFQKQASEWGHEEEEIMSFLDGIELLNNAKDKLVQLKAGYVQTSNILFKFPSTYTGQIKWSGAEEVLMQSTKNVILDIVEMKRIGFQNYSLKGQIRFDTAASGQETFFISGIIDDHSKLFSFEEFVAGDTSEANMINGKYYGQFKDNFQNIEAQFISNSGSEFASLQLYKEISDDSKIDYKKLLGIKNQYAVIIGNNNYQNLSQLQTATADARTLADVLDKKYGFEVEEPLINATRNEILMKLSHMTKKLNEDDSLLIFYAGHGRQDSETGRGYWSPVDAFEDNYINDISNDDITNILQKLNSKHILIIADSCYSGSLVLRGSEINIKKDISYFKTLTSKSSRKALTSGALQPVSDTGSNGHSAFANSLLKILTNNEKPLTANELHQNIRPSIMSEYNQTPLYNVVSNSGDMGGEFIFIPIQ